MFNVKNCEYLNVDNNFDNSIQLAKKLYLEGSVFVYPTDTIYGFGGNPFNEDAIKKINNIKGRSSRKKYILLINNIENLLRYVELKSETHIDFLLSIWPNPVSVVLPLNSNAKNLLGTQTAAFRIPNSRFCLKLLAELQMPLISTSVNKAGENPLLEPSLIKDEFSSLIDAIFYTERKSFIKASTLIDLNDSRPVLLREGKFKFEEILGKYK
ncbi:MAG TPA: L-threonylcarbamoyladenylate synthase [Ignavibacteriaceae bacterium]|nr:L-threonylcarbamoyladenylate synthase [Ignavibacteriaceae bacterium]